MRRLAALALGMLFALPAHAAEVHPASHPSEGPTYFNRLGATRADHDAAVQDCLTRTAPSHGFMPAMWKPAKAQVDVENCMVFRGWRIYRLPDSIAGALPKDRELLARELEPWVGAEAPPGALVRQWANDGGRGADSQVLLTGPISAQSMSLKSVAPRPLPLDVMVSLGQRDDRQVAAVRSGYVKAADPSTLADVSADTAIVVVTVAGKAPKQFVSFSRLPVKSSKPDWPDGQPGSFFVSPDKAIKAELKRTGAYRQTYAFAIPPGRWKIAMLGFISTCLGGPAFDVAAGDVVYLGALDLSADQLAPDLSLDPARAFLGQSPDLQARLRPAAWMNGVEQLCEIGYSYALEFPGIPVVPPPPAAPTGPPVKGEEVRR